MFCVRVSVYIESYNRHLTLVEIVELGMTYQYAASTHSRDHFCYMECRKSDYSSGVRGEDWMRLTPRPYSALSSIQTLRLLAGLKSDSNSAFLATLARIVFFVSNSSCNLLSMQTICYSEFQGIFQFHCCLEYMSMSIATAR